MDVPVLSITEQKEDWLQGVENKMRINGAVY